MIDNKFKILDCTLRDGGYLIDWDFKVSNIKKIHESLHKSGIDYIECGFLKEFITNNDKTFYNFINSLAEFLVPNQNYTLMVNFGEYDISNFEECENKNIKIRVAFKKHQYIDALEYISQLKNKNWDVFANPMSTNTYSQDELKCLIGEINKISPYGLTIVDTLGNMYENDITNIFQFIDKNTDDNLALCFHSHNNMQLSFSNAKEVLRMNIKREVILDSCLYGMGRGAGNLCTELITKYLNDNFEYRYDVFKLLKVINKIIMPFYYEKSWGYSMPYYIAAVRGCHPNYASYLVNHKLTEAEIDFILAQIDESKKTVFDKDYLEQIISRESLIIFS